MDPFQEPISRYVWETKYRDAQPGGVAERSIEETWSRVARAVASVEGPNARAWERRFREILEGFRFLPGGRILAGAGTDRQVTLFNCFVMGIVEDSLDGIFRALHEGAITMQQGGGVGYDFSTLRPRGTLARATGAIASGPVSFMRIWDSMCATVLSTGARRGAMMGTLRCDHPDVEEFAEAKRDPRELRHFNVSVLVFDAFLEAVRRDETWALVFPFDSDELPAEGETVRRRWPGRSEEVLCRVYRKVRARALWEKITRAAYDVAEPGVIFIDRINRENNLYYRETISATNPCGEIPLPPYGACNLGSVNLTAFVRDPFTEQARLDWEALRETVAVATRFLDNVIELSRYPLQAQREQAQGTRRIGLGLTGLADALILLGLRYDSEAGRQCAAEIMREIAWATWEASVELARERGAFPFFDREKYLDGVFVQRLPETLRRRIARYGVRNSHHNTVAPAGSISVLANNVSSGLEPVYRLRYRRRVTGPGGEAVVFDVTDYAVRLWEETRGNAPLPETFVETMELSPEDHLLMQAALQPYVDNSISKTIHIPESFPYESFQNVYHRAYELGLKGCTVFRPNVVTGSVLLPEAAATEAVHCCTLDREGD